MSYLSTKKVTSRKGIALLVIFAMLISSFGITTSGFTRNYAYAEVWQPKTEQPILVVTGDGIGITNEKSYTLEQLTSMTQSINLYSTINTTPTKSIYLGKGVKVEELLLKSNFTEDKHSQYPIAFVASDGYKVTFDPEHKGDSTTSKKLITPSFGIDRYYFPNLSSGDTTGKTTVDTILAFERAGDRGAPNVVPEESSLEKLSDKDAPLLMVGQQHVNEQNNPLFNKTIQKILIGDELQSVLKIGGKDYTREDILLLPRVSGNWTYTKKSGSETNYCVGVPLSNLLEGYNDTDLVEFVSADGYSNDPKTVAEIKDASNQYILAYEIGTNASDTKAVYDTAKKDPSIEGFFRVYSQNGSLLKLINEIKVTPTNGVDSTNSPYKHITNGGLDGDAPYNVDAITGATLTFEGPGLESSTPLSIRELEDQDAGVYRGDYTDIRNGKEVTLKYEGISLNYLLNQMASGTTGIKLTDFAYKVILKNRTRQSIAEFTLDQIEEAEAKGKPIIIAYGTSEANGSNARPFVYDSGAGADSKLGNEDGCIKLVYDKSVFNEDLNTEYTKFGNVAYVYIAENDSPGYKHDKAPYNTSENYQYIITLTGDKLGREVNYTVKQLEDMVEYDNGSPASDGMGYRGEYSLSNSTYWYTNEYEGVKLWDLLKKAGITDSMTKGKDGETIVHFTATDGYKDFDKFTINQISNPDLFGYYEKNPKDLDDGNYISKASEDLRSTGYPVLVAYGVNGYPYVIDNDLDGYKSGLGNDGGPLRIISGKVDYQHANGSRQAKLLDKIIIGNEVNYSTHIGNPDEAYKALASNKIEVKVIGMDGSTIKTESFTVEEIENMIYGSEVSNAERIKARIKDFYGVQKGSNVYEDLYEGVDLSYFLKEKVEIPGNKGSVTFTSSDESIIVSLDEIFSNSSILAFAKNGAPMVYDKNSDGYESSYIDGSGEKVNVKNDGGPLMMILPQTEEQKTNNTAISLSGITSITINLQPDKYAHLEDSFNELANSSIIIEGSGTKLGNSKEFKISELEGKQNLVVTGDYNIKKENSEKQIRYRGIDLYSFLRSVDVGLQSNASEVVFTAGDGYSITLPLEDIMKADYINSVSNENNLKVILAYGSSSINNSNIEDGKPLVQDKSSVGYDEAYNNSGGPVALIVGQKSSDDINSSKILKDVVKITVNASETSKWKHDMSPIYSQYLDSSTLEITGTALNESKIFTLRELEAMDDIIIRDSYTYIGEHQHEGLDIWRLITEKVGLKPGAEPTVVKVVASDGFSRDILSVFGKDALENGIADGLERKKIMLSYAGDGNPLVTDTSSEGYTSGNEGGPLRMITHLNQGSCLKNVVQIIVDGNVSSQVSEDSSSEDIFTTYLSGVQEGLPMAGIRAIALDDNGGAWIGTYGGGASYIDSTGEITTYNASSDIVLPGLYVNDIAIDNEGGVWLTLGGMDPKNQNGVVYLKEGNLTHYTTENTDNKLLSDFVQSVEVDDNGIVWFGTGLGLNSFNPKTNKWSNWTKEDGIPAKAVSTIKADSKGGIWIGAYPDTVDENSNVYSGGYAYLDSEGEIRLYKDTENTKFADQWVRSFSIDSEGGVWVVRSGSYSTMENVGGRIDYIAPNGEIEAKYTGNELLPGELKDNAEIRTLTIDYKGSLWYGTSSKGIFFSKDPKTVNKSFNIENSSWQDTSSLDSIWTLIVTDDTVWAGSNGGVVKALSKNIFKKSSSSKAKFIDINGHWAEDKIMYLYSKGIVNGTSENTFSPNENITRAEIIKLLVSILEDVDLKAIDGGKFKDVPNDKWYASYINWAAEKGIVFGDENGNFGPNEPASREEIAVMVHDFTKAMNIELVETEEYKKFKDESKISTQAKDAVRLMQTWGIIDGRPDGNFDAKGLVTRAEAIKMIYLLLEKIN